MDLVFEVTGWIGAGIMLMAYLSVSMGWLRPGRRFQTANLVGACAFIVNGAYHGAWASAATNIVWFLISIISLIRAWLKPAPTDPPQKDDADGEGSILKAALALPER